MAASKILYTNKQAISQSSVPINNQVTSDDMNEIKNVVNQNAEILDEVGIEILTQDPPNPAENQIWINTSVDGGESGGQVYTLPVSSQDVLGGVKVGGDSTLYVDADGTTGVNLIPNDSALRVNNGIGVNVDNSTIIINGNNQLQANADQSLSDTSTNPIANQVVYQSLQHFSATVPITPFTISSGTSWTQLSSPASWDTDGVYLYTYTYTYNGLTSSDYLDIVLDSQTLTSGIIAPVVNSVDNGIQFWASEQPSNSIQVVGGVYTTTVLSALNLEV